MLIENPDLFQKTARLVGLPLHCSLAMIDLSTHIFLAMCWAFRFDSRHWTETFAMNSSESQEDKVSRSFASLGDTFPNEH